MPSAALSHTPDRAMALATVALLAAVYLLTFSGQFRSIDEYALYARVESLALGQGLATPQLEFAQRHHPVGPLEPGQPVLAAPLYLLGKAIPGASTVASVMLFSALVTALTGGVLYAIVRAAGYGPGTGALTALAWGIGTTAWPYARSFFREPLLGLLWTVATLLCLRWQQTRLKRYALGCLLAAAAAAAVKISSISAVPVFALALLWNPSAHRLRLSRRTGLLLLAGAGCALLAAMALWRLRYDRPLPIARYTWDYDWARFLQVAYGLLISPLKGVAVFSPILLASLPGWRALARRNSTLVWLIAVLTLALLYTYGNYGQWHGGSVIWGPRFMVPLLPLLMLPLAPALGDQHPLVRGWVILWSAVGLVVQAAAGTASWSDAVWQLVPAYVNNALTGLDGIPWWSWRLLPRSPALMQVALWAPRQLDMLWLRTLTDGTLACDRLLGGTLALGVAVAASAVARLALRAPAPEAARRTATLSTAAVLVCAGMLLARSARDSNDFAGLSRSEAAGLAAAVSAPAGQEHRLVYVSNDLFTYPWLGMIKGHVIIAWNSPHDEAALASVARQVATCGAERIWLVLDRVHAQADVNLDAARYALAREAYETDGRWIGGYEALSYLPQRAMEPAEGAARWANGLALRQVALSEQRVQAGSALLVDLGFEAENPLAEDLTLYVHLVPPAGPVLAGRDGPPAYGGAPTSRWETGETHLERRAVPIPADAAPGPYALIVGWLTPEGTPVPLKGLAESEAALVTIEIVPGP